VQTTPTIIAQHHSLTAASPGIWKLAVDWWIANPTGAEAYVVITTPLVMRAANPLVLDHTDLVGGTVNPNEPPRFHIIALAPGEARTETIEYGIALAAGAHVTAIGRFGWSDVRPDPRWEQDRNGKQVAAWQRNVDSASFVVAAP
jgi:hypothetical protein